MADKPTALRFHWERAFLAGDFTKTQRVVGLVLAIHLNKKTATAHPSLATIAKLSGCKPLTVHRAIEAIEAEGFLLVKRAGKSAGRGHVNTYHFIVPGQDLDDDCPHENVAELPDGTRVCANPECRAELPTEK